MTGGSFDLAAGRFTAARIDFSFQSPPVEYLTGVHIHWKALAGVISAGKYIFTLSSANYTQTGFVGVTNEPMPADMQTALAYVVQNNVTLPANFMYVNVHSNVNVDGAVAGIIRLTPSSGGVAATLLPLFSLVAIMLLSVVLF